MTGLPTLRELRESGVKPRVHGNGFIQLDLTPGVFGGEPGRRLHIWHEDIPSQRVRSSVHDHVFDLKSRVICGELIHLEYGLLNNEQGMYRVYQAEAQPNTNNTILVDTGRAVDLDLVNKLKLYAGDRYTFEAFKFHDTDFRGLTATIMEKVAVDAAARKPSVLVPYDQEPDNEFDREGFDPEILWPFIKRALELAKWGPS